MKIQDMLANIPMESHHSDLMSIPELLRFCLSRHLTGIAVAKSGDTGIYLAFSSGEPEGAVYCDEKGTFFGDKATVLIKGDEIFTVLDVKPDLVSTLVMGCRIYEKSYLKTNSACLVPDIGLKSTGIGILSLKVLRKNMPENGVCVSIRKEGMVVGSDFTTDDGSVRFRLMYGDYTCVVEDKVHAIRTFR
jgi:hypothetical protein